jgi:hypothetical protein
VGWVPDDTGFISSFDHTPKPFVRKAFAKYLECGIFAHGFARARCGDCGHDYFVAFSCKGRGVCPSCTTRRMVETAAHLSDHVFPRLPVRQWVLSVPKRLRYFMQRDGAVLSMVLRIFLRVIAQTLQTHSPGAAHMDKAGLHIGAIAFIHRFGSSLHEHVHFHVCVVDGVFEELVGEGAAQPQAQATAPRVIFHPAIGIDAATVAPVQTTLQKRILRAFVARGLLEKCDAKDMLGYKHSGFSVDAGVCIEAHDRAALERLLRYCARPPFSMERLRKEGSKLVYRCAKQRSEPTSDKRGAKADELHLTPLELIDRIAALVPPPRTHRHRYFGVLAPNSPLRAAVTALATPAQAAPVLGASISTGECAPGVVPMSSALPSQSEPVLPKRAAHYLWAVLIARIYEVFPLLCPLCGGHMRIIAFITHSAEIRHILNHIGVESAPPHITPARGPPLWEGCDAPVDDGAQGEPDWDLAAQPDEVDQRVNW